MRGFSDFVSDDEFDASYDGLMRLGALLGEVKSRATPQEVIEAMPHATYKEWATEGSDIRCPICLDNYEDEDPVQRLPECNHWMHRDCLTQWLRGAQSCPVCRGRVKCPRPGGAGTATEPGLEEFTFGPATP